MGFTLTVPLAGFWIYPLKPEFGRKRLDSKPQAPRLGLRGSAKRLRMKKRRRFGSCLIRKQASEIALAAERAQPRVVSSSGCGRLTCRLSRANASSVGLQPVVRRKFPLEIPYRTSFRIGPLIGGIPQRLDDMSGQAVVDFPAPRRRLSNARNGIAVPVVLSAMPHQYTPRPLNRSDQTDPLHDTTNSSTLRIPGISPLVRS